MRRLVRLLVAPAALAAACSSVSPGKEDSRPIVIAHRGASGLAPEHTFAAYDLAIEMGADYIEQDLQLTLDGVLVVVHDDTLDRTARGPARECTGPVRDKTAAQLEACDFGLWYDERHPNAPRAFAGQKAPSLETVSRRYGPSTRYYIETKQPEAAPGMEEALLALLREHDLLPCSADDRRVLVQSFSPESLEKLHRLSPDLPLVLLLGRDGLAEPVDATLADIARYAVGIGPYRGNVHAELVAAAKRHGLLVHPYTVNEPEEMRRLLELGVDGLFTDYPNRCCEIR